MSIIDRYVVRQVLVPFLLGLLVFTFIFIIQPLMVYAEDLVAKGVSAVAVTSLIALLIPQALAITIPMALLLALLIAFGRLSADREFVAMQACGVSLRRLLRPVAFVSVGMWLLTSYVLIELVPASNQRFLDGVFEVASQHAEGDVKARTFFTDLPNLVLYVRDVPPEGGWKGVFLADVRPEQGSPVYLSERGRIVIDRARRRIDIELVDGTKHSINADGKYDVLRFENFKVTVDPTTLFAQQQDKGPRQMTITELRAQIAERERQIDPTSGAPFSTHNERMEIHKRFSIPVACLVFGLIGLALGATHRRDGALGSFVLGIVVVFAYYVPLMIGPSLVKGHYLPPWLGMWLPNFVLGALGVLMFVWRDRLADQPFNLRVPLALPALARRRRGRSVPGLAIIDSYITSAYLRYSALAVVALLGVFYIASFLDLSDKLFKGQADWLTLADYFRHATPEFLYYVLPLGVLLGTLVTIATLTKNSELIVMKACGISLYRAALPLIAASLIAGAAVFALQETVLGPSTRRAEEIKDVMKGGAPRLGDVLHNRWLVGRAGQIYHYISLDQENRRIYGLEIYEFTPEMDRLTRRSHVDFATYVPGRSDAPADVWELRRGWTRDFSADAKDAVEFAVDQRQLETPSYFEAEELDSRYMGYAQLRNYTERLRASGFDVLEQDVWLGRKIAFPFVTLIMTLLAVPFASTIGRSGAMGGIAVGIALAISYWTLITVFAALGSGGALPPMLAAWAPNLLFGSAALYLLLTVRT